MQAVPPAVINGWQVAPFNVKVDAVKAEVVDDTDNSSRHVGNKCWRRRIRPHSTVRAAHRHEYYLSDRLEGSNGGLRQREIFVRRIPLVDDSAIRVEANKRYRYDWGRGCRNLCII